MRNKSLESDTEQMFSKVLRETHDLSKTIDFMIKWAEENRPDRGYICTNNEHEALTISFPNSGRWYPQETARTIICEAPSPMQTPISLRI